MAVLCLIVITMNVIVMNLYEGSQIGLVLISKRLRRIKMTKEWLAKYNMCCKFAYVLSKRCHEKLSVNVDLFDDMINDLLDEIAKRANNDCNSCVYDDCNLDCRNCKNTEVDGLYEHACCCNSHLTDILPCPHYKRKEVDRDEC